MRIYGTVAFYDTAAFHLFLLMATMFVVGLWVARRPRASFCLGLGAGYVVYFVLVIVVLLVRYDGTPRMGILRLPFTMLPSTLFLRATAFRDLATRLSFLPLAALIGVLGFVQYSVVGYIVDVLARSAGRRRAPAMRKERLVLTSLVVLAEISLLFLPIGPLSSVRDFAYRSRSTRSAGLTPCVQCGRPADDVTYRKANGRTVTVSSYCSRCAPFSLAGGGGLGREGELLFGSVMVCLCIFGTAMGYRGVKSPYQPPQNWQMLLKNHVTALLVGFGFYCVFSLFFWVPMLGW